MASRGFLPLFGLAVLYVLALASLPSARSQKCKSQKLTSNDVYPNCMDLPALDSFLHYSYDASNSSLSIVFIAPPAKPEGWVAWAVNPTGSGMAGAQTLLAFKDSDGSVVVKTYDIQSYSDLKEGKLSFDVWDLKGEYDQKQGLITIFGKLKVPGKVSTLNQVWQVGPGVSDGMPMKHDFAAANLNAKGPLDLTGKQTTISGGADSRTKKKNIHGILNALSWGILFPLGVVMARYLRVFESADPAWFYLHISCQLSAYVLGVAGWATGLKLGSESKGVEYSQHRNIGIALFCICTVQVFALFLRPKKDHKYRFYWNIYHHSFGYTILILGIINVFKGLDILRPDNKWKVAYIVVLAVLAGIALLLEVFTWVVVMRRKSRKSTKPYDG